MVIRGADVKAEAANLENMWERPAPKKMRVKFVSKMIKWSMLDARDDIVRKNNNVFL